MRIEIRHFHLFCGLGGGALGFNHGHARIGRAEARFRCIGGIDSDPSSITDFDRLTGARGTVLDLFDRGQYRDWHGHEPPPAWREATVADIHRAAGGERPHIVFTSPPCKAFSGLLPGAKSKTRKYQALSRLTVRGIRLALEAWGEDPPEFFLLENVPRIQHRGRPLLEEIAALLRAHGYAVAETTHNCGELGNLAQSRKRFLLVARHIEKVPPFLYEPEKHPLRAIGDVLDEMPLPGEPSAGPMHRVPSLQWKTWIRLALIEAGGDWRSLNRLTVTDGQLRDYLIVPERRNDYLGVVPYTQPCAAISGRGLPTNGRYSVADPRFFASAKYGQYGVRRWNETLGTVSGQSAPGGGRYSVADPRVRFAGNDGRRPHYQSGGHYGVVAWNTHAYAVTAKAKLDRGPYSVADPRLPVCVSRKPARCARAETDRSAPHGHGTPAPPNSYLPDATDSGVYRIRALDNTWHRPLTTLELAALQGLVDPEDLLLLHGHSDSAWRERIGNAVPPPAAAAIASTMGQVLLLSWTGETLPLAFTPIWVRPLAIAVSVASAIEPIDVSMRRLV